jgi:LysR family transcriptional regulator, transcription activator of glutamate synthase operon
MDTHQLRAFAEAAKCENMSAAADRLGMSQPSLSQAIKKLETSLGVALFDRHGRSIQLNENGQILLRHANISFRAMENAIKEVNDLSRTNQRTVRLIARQPMGDHAATLQGFYEKYPDITLSYIVPNEQTQVSDYDVEFFSSSNQQEGSNILKLGTENYVVLVNNSHRFANRESVELKELKKDSFLLSPANSEMSATVHGMFRECGFKPKIAAYISNYWDSMKLVEKGVGVCIATEVSWLVNSSLNIKVLPISDAKRARTLYLRWPAGAYLSSATTALIEHLASEFGANPDVVRTAVKV